MRILRILVAGPKRYTHLNSLLALYALALVFSSFVQATPKPPVEQPSADTLREIPHKFFDSLRIHKSLSLENKTKIFIEPASITFSKHWEREHRGDVSKSYKEKTLKRYRSILQDSFREACEKNQNFSLASSNTEADIIMQPILENLNIFAPDDSFNDAWVFRSGSARLHLKIVDARNDEILIEYIDSRETLDRSGQRPMQSSRVTNTRDFRMLFEKWSKRVFSSLEEMNSK